MRCWPVVACFSFIMFGHSLVLGQTSGNKDFDFHGFAFWTLTHQSGEANRGVQLEHVWLVFNKGLTPNQTVTVILTPKGPPQIVHNAHLVWKNFCPPVIDAVTVGRFIPPFGQEFWALRIDQTKTVRYSRILDANRFVARDNGIQLSGHVLPLRWDVGVFTGDRTGGGFPSSDMGKPDGYLRVRFVPTSHGQYGFGADLIFMPWVLSG